MFKKAFKTVLKFCLALILVFVVGVFIGRNSYSRVVVSGHSMDYTLQNGEHLWVENLPWGTYKQGSVVVLKESDKRMVKRIIGTPGDTLVFKGDTLYRNGKALDEPYVTDSGYEKGLLKGEVTLAKDEYFVMGDNRDVSNDSRYFGAIKKNELQGRVVGYE